MNTQEMAQNDDINPALAPPKTMIYSKFKEFKTQDL